MSAASLGIFLIGCLVGALGVLVLTGLALYFVDMRRALREGEMLEGDGLERLKKRESER